MFCSRKLIVVAGLFCFGLIAVVSPNLSNADDKPSDGLVTDVDKLKSEVREMKALLAEIRDSLNEIKNRQPATNSNLSPTTIRIQDTDGQPLAGYQIELKSIDNTGPTIFATGTSDKDGVALSRKLPHGAYKLTVSQKGGWSTYFHTGVNIEFGAPFEKVVVAPSLAKDKATIRLNVSLDSTALKGLRFGTLLRYPLGSSHHSIPYSPEPGKQAPSFVSYPTMGDGVENASIQLGISMSRLIKQPNGETHRWFWNGRRHSLIVGENETIQVPAGLVNEQRIDTNKVASHFEYNKKLLNAVQKVGYVEMKSAQAKVIQEIEVPAGTITLSIDGILGKPNPELAAQLGASEEKSIWLRANLPPDSQWLDRYVNFDDWNHKESPTTPSIRISSSRRSSREIASRVLKLKTGDEFTLNLTSP